MSSRRAKAIILALIAAELIVAIHWSRDRSAPYPARPSAKTFTAQLVVQNRAIL